MDELIELVSIDYFPREFFVPSTGEYIPKERVRVIELESPDSGIVEKASEAKANAYVNRRHSANEKDICIGVAIIHEEVVDKIRVAHNRRRFMDQEYGLFGEKSIPSN